MQWQVNKYYPLPQAKDEALAVASSLLHGYPLTRACLEILGEELLNKLEFGFFETGFEIIHQGESGKDLFLLCRGVVDVIFNGQVVVDMEGPTLLGDKAIVEPQSTRAATIRVAKGQDALFIKIPMGLFLRNFNDHSIADSQFQQEVQIFCNVFLGIQQRLFDYIYLQKNLWEEVTTTLNLLNSQMIAKSLDNKKEMAWSDQFWEVIKRYLAQHLKFHWPEKIPLNATTLRDVLYQVSENKSPRKSFKGNDNEYLVSQHLQVRNWLIQASEEVIKVLPEDQLPFQIGEIELFNPRNYHMRMSKLLRSAEKKFSPKLQTNTIVSQPMAVPPVSNFFGKGARANEFQLERYLNSFEQVFSVKFPKRILAQLGQRSALITAECENQFNTSVARMQKFLDKAKRRAIAPAPTSEDPKQAKEQLKAAIAKILKGFMAYERRIEMIPGKKLGEIVYIAECVPTKDELIKSSGARKTRAELEKAFQQLQVVYLSGKNKPPSSFVKNNVFLCQAGPADIVPSKELQSHYWMPISEGVALMRGEELIEEDLPSGLLLGGKGWGQEEEQEEHQEYYLKMPSHSALARKDQTFLIFVIPPSSFSWDKDEKPMPEKYLKQQLPTMQWLIDKQLQSVSFFLDKRDQKFQKWFEIVQILNLEKKVQKFENVHTLLTAKQFQSLQTLLHTTIHLQLDADVQTYSDQLAKKIYNHILRKMGEDFSNMPVEERSNKAYTKWRYILSEVVKALDGDSADEAETGRYTPPPVYEVLNNKLKNSLATYLGRSNSQKAQLSEQNPQLDFIGLVKDAEGVSLQKRIALYLILIELFEHHVYKLIGEMSDSKKRLENIQDQRPQTETDAVQLEMIMEDVEKLSHLLQSTA